jgi:hypothetical protein
LLLQDESGESFSKISGELGQGLLDLIQARIRGLDAYRSFPGRQEIKVDPEHFAEREQLVESRRGLAPLVPAQSGDADPELGGELLLRQPSRLPEG